jgi:hypothetical protein
MGGGHHFGGGHHGGGHHGHHWTHLFYLMLEYICILITFFFFTVNSYNVFTSTHYQH